MQIANAISDADRDRWMDKQGGETIRPFHYSLNDWGIKKYGIKFTKF